MSTGVNKATLVGNVGKEPLIITTPNKGVRLAKFPFVTCESWIDRTTGLRREKKEWHNIVIYGEGLVSMVEKYITKGSKLYIEGTIQTRKMRAEEPDSPSIFEIILQGYNCTLCILDERKFTNQAEEPSNTC